MKDNEWVRLDNDGWKDRFAEATEQIKRHVDHVYDVNINNSFVCGECYKKFNFEHEANKCCTDAENDQYISISSSRINPSPPRSVSAG